MKDASSLFSISPLLRLSSLVFLLLASSLAQPPSMLAIDANSSLGANTSLQYHLCGAGASEFGSHTALQLSGGVHYLDEGPFCLLRDLANISISGQRSQPHTVVYCRGERGEQQRGIAFYNISSLHLANFQIVNCGGVVPPGLPGNVNSTFAYLGPKQKAVLIVTHSRDVTVENVSIDGCMGFGVVFINPLGDTAASAVSVTNTNSQRSSECLQPLERNDMLCAGSGIVFIFADTEFTNALVKYSENYTAFLSVTNCLFANNANVVPSNRLTEVVTLLGGGFETQPLLLTGGLSLAVYTGQRNFFVDVKVTDTTFASNSGNIANFIVNHYNTLHMSSTRFDGVTFTDNTVTGSSDGSRGAGLLVIVALFFDSLNSLQQSQGDIFDVVEIYNSHFTRNSAYNGGALMFYMTPQNISDVRVVVRETTFTDNVAWFGSALYVFQFQSLISNSATYVHLEDVVASGNTYPGSSVVSDTPESTGVFLISHSANVTLVGTEQKGCLFHDNDVSVVMAVQTNVVLRGRLSFEDNHGFRGGALNLLDSSILFIHNSSAIRFLRNSADLEGGAVYINTLGFSITTTCAVQILAERIISVVREELQLLDIEIVFSNNSALVAGNSIYGTPIYFCFFIPTTALVPANAFESNEAILYDVIFDFRETVSNGHSELNSIPNIICICENEMFSYDCDNCSLSLTLNETVIPGDTITVFLNPVDVVGNPVTSLLYTIAHSDSYSDGVQVDTNQDVQSLSGLSHCSPVQFRIFSPETTRIYLDFYAAIGGEKATVELNSTVCPPGFSLRLLDVNSDKYACVCSEFIEKRLESSCNLTQYTIARPTNYWVGTRNDSSGKSVIQFVSTCPINYCRDDVTDVDLRVPDQLCVQGRSGTLCGACREGLSSQFGTARCRKCSNAWLATLPLYALVGALSVVIAFLIDVTITHGLINGLFFYSNIVMVNLNIFFQGNQSGFLFMFLSWVNMDIGFPICFYDGMTETAKLGLQYIFPAYIILLIALIIALSQHSLLVQRVLSQLDGIHVLVSMFYVAFLKLFRTVIDTVTFVSIVSENKKRSEVVWFFDGTQHISDPLVIVLITVGSLTMIAFILPYMVLFVFSNYIQRKVNLTRLNAYFDASLAPYRDKLRFWFGARLILTTIIYIIIANRGTNNPTLSLTLELSFLVGFTIIQAYIHPYKKIGVALVDMFFLLNLIAVTLATSYTIQKEKRSSDQARAVSLSVALTFLVHVCIFLWHLLRRLRKNKKFKSKTDELVGVAKRVVRVRSGREMVEMVTKRENGARDEGEQGPVSEGGRGLKESLELTPPQRAEPSRTTVSLEEMGAAPNHGRQVHLSSSQLREPVLDFLN